MPQPQQNPQGQMGRVAKSGPGIAGGGPAMGQPRMMVNGGPGPPPPGEPARTYIQPSHPHHPQHQAWRAQQGYPPAPPQPPQQLHINTSFPPPPPQPNGSHQSPITGPSARPTSAAPRYSNTPQQAPPQPSPQQPYRTAGGPPPQTRTPSVGGPASAMAASLALHGNGPITATATNVGPALSRLTAMNESLSLALETEDINQLHAVVGEFFTETGIIKYGLYDKAAQLNKVFEIPCSAFPRFHHINAICGVTYTTLSPSFVREFFLTAPEPGTGRPIHIGYLLRADETTWISRSSNGVKIELTGTLIVHFVVTVSSGLRVESMEFDSRGHEELIAREAVVSERVEKFFESGEEAGKGKGKKVGPAMRRRSSTKEEDEERPAWGEKTPGLGSVLYENHLLPASPVGSFGITEMGMRCLEIAESVAQLQDLIAFSLQGNMGPIQSLARFAESDIAHRNIHLHNFSSFLPSSSNNNSNSSSSSSRPLPYSTPPTPPNHPRSTSRVLPALPTRSSAK